MTAGQNLALNWPQQHVDREQPKRKFNSGGVYNYVYLKQLYEEIFRKVLNALFRESFLNICISLTQTQIRVIVVKFSLQRCNLLLDPHQLLLPF